MTSDARAIALREAWHYGEAWRHPDVCDSLQRAWLQRVRSAVDSGRRGSFLQRWGRQVGKSWANIAFALCEMQRRPGIIIRYAALTGKSCLAIVKPTFEALATGMPSSIRPVLSEQKGTIAAPNGSVMVFAGTDAEQFDRLRGPRAHLIMLDESAFYAELERVEAALTPQLNTTHGLVLYFSSPPESTAHPFAKRDAAHQASGNWSKATIYESPRYDAESIANIERAEAERLGMTREQLLASTYWEREFRANIVTEEQRAALPAWTDEAQAALVGDWVRPAHFDAYASLDPGKTGDPHAALFGLHDPATNSLTIEDELELRSATTHIGAWAEAIKAKEGALWGVNRWEGTLSGATMELLKAHKLDDLFLRVHSETAPRQPFLRVGDDDARVTVDLGIQHGIAVLPSAKHDKHLWVDTVNQLIRERRIKIHRRCTRLLEQMRSTLWNRTRSQWERTDKDHGDLVDCFEAGTLISTARGDVPVEQVRTGDMAMTRDGWRRVLWSLKGRTAPLWQVETESGRILRGTAEHPFWTQRGWVALSRLTANDTLIEWTNPFTSSGTAAGGSATQPASAEIIASTTSIRSGGGRSTSIEQSGRTLTGRFRAAMSSIMSMVTRSTTRWRTSPASPKASTNDTTWTQSAGRAPAPAPERHWRDLRRSEPLPSGGKAQLAGSGIASTPSPSGLGFQSASTGALSAASCSAPRSPEHPNDAVERAKQRPADAAGLTTSPEVAPGAERRSSSTSTPPSGAAVGRVRSVRPTNASAPVFNLSVEGTHEYFANGVLVHNCLVYMARNVAWHRDCRPPPPVDKGLEMARQMMHGDKRSGLTALVTGFRR